VRVVRVVAECPVHKDPVKSGIGEEQPASVGCARRADDIDIREFELGFEHQRGAALRAGEVKIVIHKEDAVTKDLERRSIMEVVFLTAD